MSQNFLYTSNKKVFYLVRDTKGFKPIRYCQVCNIFRPPTRASHCYTCGVCVVGFDHHCVWLGTCIGKRNYLDFIIFLISLLIFIISNLMILFQNETKNISFIIVPICILFLILVTLLFCFHVYLIFIN